MTDALLARSGLRARDLHDVSMASVVLCLALWIRAKTVDQSSRENAERRAIFVGLWPAVLWLMGDALGRREGRGQREAPSRLGSPWGLLSRRRG